ncbi:GST-5 protein [Aphelenchoides avenae]|nr:GST-5 protein [Aphelenchus avenae]
MAPKYKLYYFDLRARAEPIRMLFHYVGQPFEDVAVSLNPWDNWLEFKPKTPLGQLPYLEVIEDGRETLVVAHSIAILRYLAKKFGLEAETVDEQAVCDMYAGHVEDVLQRGLHYLWTKIGLEPVEKEPELRKSVFLPAAKEFGEALEKQLAKNGNGFVVGKKLAWVDFHVACFTDMYMQGIKTVFSHYPLVEKHRLTVFEIPAINEYLKKRPDYPY